MNCKCLQHALDGNSRRYGQVEGGSWITCDSDLDIEYRDGDLFTSGLPALAHGCNTKGKMGSGIAVQFRQLYPLMYEEYAQMCKDGDLGLGDVFIWKANPVIFNLMTQENPGPNASVEAINRCVTTMLMDGMRLGITEIGMPRIGAGIGGLKWSQVEEQILMAKRIIRKSRGVTTFPKVIVYTLPGQKFD